MTRPATGLIRSWVESANAPGCDFPLNNLPYGVFSTTGGAPAAAPRSATGFSICTASNRPGCWPSRAIC